MRRCVLVVAALVFPALVAAQERPIAVSTLTTTDTGATSICVGCAVGSSTATGGIKAGPVVATQVTVNSVGIIATDGRIPAISSTYFASLSAANLTSVPAANLTGTCCGAATNVAVLNAANTFTNANITLAGVTSGNKSVQIGPATPGANDAAFITMLASNSQKNWRIDANATGDAFSITPSTATGGSTFTTAAWSVTSAGNETLTGVALAANGSNSAPTWSFSSDTDTGIYRDSANRIGFAVNATEVFQVGITGSGNPSWANLLSGAFGTGAVTGPFLGIGRNSSGNGAPATVQFGLRDGNVRYLWVDTAGDVRVGSTQPTETSGDTGGTVVGTQTSQRSTKRIFGAFRENDRALRAMLNTPLFEFEYLSGAYNHQRFVGITTDDSPIFGMDLGRSFNPVTAFGYTVAAFKAQQQIIDQLAARVRALEGR